MIIFIKRIAEALFLNLSIKSLVKLLEIIYLEQAD